MHRFIPAMASIAGPRIAEIKVRHHARQFGQSKYGLSRIYKVLLDLMVIKTVASFTSRPLLWFSLLCLPLTLIGAGDADRLGCSWRMPGNGGMSCRLTGSGIIFLSAVLMLLASGTLGELIYRLGDVRPEHFARLTMKTSEARKRFINDNSPTRDSLDVGHRAGWASVRRRWIDSMRSTNRGCDCWALRTS